MCRVSWNLGASTSWSPKGLSRPVQELLYHFVPLLWHSDKETPFMLNVLNTKSTYVCWFHDSNSSNSWMCLAGPTSWLFMVSAKCSVVEWGVSCCSSSIVSTLHWSGNLRYTVPLPPRPSRCRRAFSFCCSSSPLVVEQLDDALLLPTLPFSASEMRSAPCEDEGDLLASETVVMVTNKRR